MKLPDDEDPGVLVDSFDGSSFVYPVLEDEFEVDDPGPTRSSLEDELEADDPSE